MKLNKFSRSTNISKDSISSRINKLAIPILISYLSHFLFSIGDQAIIGRTSITEYAAVSVVANILFALTGTIGIITLTLNILGSKKLGSKDFEGYRDLFSTVLTIAIIIGLIFELACLLFGKLVLKYVFSMSGDLLGYGYSYLSIAGLSLGLNTVLFIFSSYYKSIEKTRIILVATVSSCIINLIIDYTLVFGKFGFPKLGVAGAAIGTVVGLIINTVIYMIGFKLFSSFVFQFKVKLTLLRELIRSYIPLLGQDLIESTAFTIILTMIITNIGTDEIAIYGLVNIILQVVVLPIYAYCSVSMTIVSKANGAGDTSLIKSLPGIVIRNLLVITLGVGAVAYGYNDILSRIITDKYELLIGVGRIIGLALSFQVFNISNQVFRYVLNALEDEKWVLYYSAVVGAIALISIYFMAIIINMELYGVFIGLGISYMFNTFGFYLRYKMISKKRSSQYTTKRLDVI